MDEVDFNDLLLRYKDNPFELARIETPHTGMVWLKVENGMDIHGPKGTWQEIKGTLLYVLERQKNLKSIYSPIDGTVEGIQSHLDSQFVESNEYIMSIKHPMTKEEVIAKILCDILYLFRAPERANYLFSPHLAAIIEKKRERNVTIRPGDEILIMSRMKRDLPLIYEGEPGIIYRIYFTPSRPVEQGEPLLGICPVEKIRFVNRLVQQVHLEWEL
jgi:biotin carboxyl carrier protein